MTLGHFGGSTGDAALVENPFFLQACCWVRYLGGYGGFRNRSFTMVAAIAGFGIAAIVSGSLGPSLFAAFLPVSFLMGACSPLYAGTQTALMQEQIPPEYLGRVFGLYGTIMAWAMPMGLAAPSVFADLLGAPLWFVGSGATMVLLAMAMLLAPSVRSARGKEIPADSIAQVFEKKEAAAIGSSVSLQALCDDERYCTDIPHRAPYSSPTIIFGFGWLAQGQNARAGNWAKAKIDVSNLFLAWLRFQ